MGVVESPAYWILCRLYKPSADRKRRLGSDRQDHSRRRTGLRNRTGWDDWVSVRCKRAVPFRKGLEAKSAFAYCLCDERCRPLECLAA